MELQSFTIRSESVQYTVTARLRKDDSGRFGMLRDQGFHHVQDFLLLATGQLGNRFKHRARFATRLERAPGCFAEQYFHRNAEGLCHRNQHVGTRQVAAGLPVQNIRVLFADLAGQLPHRETGCFAQFAQVALRCHALTIISERKKLLHVVTILTISGQCK
jgi:hypothetical protein